MTGETENGLRRAGIAALMKPNTTAVFTESPGSLTFEMQDIPAIADVAHKHGALASGLYTFWPWYRTRLESPVVPKRRIENPAPGPTVSPP